MKYISHRGNINGRCPEKENSINYIMKALNMGFDVEIDVWYTDNKFYLGHDSPINEISLEHLILYSNSLWCHSKNIEALSEFLQYQQINCFFHQTDEFTLTSHNQIWTYFNKTLTKHSILLKFEMDYDFVVPNHIAGICSDHIEFYKANNK